MQENLRLCGENMLESAISTRKAELVHAAIQRIKGQGPGDDLSSKGQALREARSNPEDLQRTDVARRRAGPLDNDHGLFMAEAGVKRKEREECSRTYEHHASMCLRGLNRQRFFATLLEFAEGKITCKKQVQKALNRIQKYDRRIVPARTRHTMRLAQAGHSRAIAEKFACLLKKLSSNLDAIQGPNHFLDASYKIQTIIDKDMWGKMNSNGRVETCVVRQAPTRPCTRPQIKRG